jgi:cytoplasmic iron level regulating protein YaaA (DUF328/UPF0246 family)
MIVFLSCVKSKANNPCEAQKMYTSDLFKKSLHYAKSLKPSKIYILSAKYGLLELADVISPYEQTLNAMTEKERKIWAYKVIKQCEQKGIDFAEKTVFLCGNNYRKYVMQKFKNATAPLSKLGIGQQLQFYKNNTKKE